MFPGWSGNNDTSHSISSSNKSFHHTPTASSSNLALGTSTSMDTTNMEPSHEQQQQHPRSASFLTPNRFDVGYERVIPGGASMDVDLAVSEKIDTKIQYQHQQQQQATAMDML